MGRAMSRRGFLGLAAGGASYVGLAGIGVTTDLPPPAGPQGAAVRIGKVYLGRPQPGWPAASVDLQAEVRRFEEQLARLRPSLSDLEFIDGGLASDDASLRVALGRLRAADGVLVIHLSLGVGGMLNRIFDTGLPVVMFTMPYAGHEWHTMAALQKAGKRIDIFPSSDYADLVECMRPLRAIGRMKRARVLYLGGGPADPKYVEAVKARFGTEIVSICDEDLVKAYEAVELKEAEAAARQWVARAERVVEPTADDILRASRMDIALGRLVEARQASAITINCLGMGLIQRGMGYPCLGFARLNDRGLGGVCEADLKSTLTHLVFLYLVGRPGFVTDPVIDLSNNTIIHAHCVAATKMDGPDGPAAPYVIRSHLEDGKGCVLQVKMRLGQKVSVARLIGTDIMLFSTAEIVDVPDVDRGCRTKITTRVHDARKFLDNWSCGLHRVVFYGDHTRDVERFSRLMNLRVVREGEEDLRDVPGLEWDPHVHA